ncbi:MarR family transcriptional regulator [Shewanella sp. SG41-4]|uniref:MarR family winged helix-turn-helix transcriptional regulator n=1 Tax=Shewanella sp. SG41-4 TaxID=2760976 RepID=UPI00160433DE|nr:MarR family transcriptional regulator [Shewanella sp. SG41-4]MBB1438987.1 MarR family transcriptional regulator [Shewanella sp. SG41-4]
MDRVDKIIEQWNRERPDLDVSSMGLVGRFKQITQRLSLEMAKTFTEHGLNPANFDLLATLRRAGPPFALSPNDLIASTMVTSGTMTNRIDQLVKAGLVERIQNPNDRRSIVVSLTKKGFTMIEPTLKAQVATQNRLTSCLSEDESKKLNNLLRKLLMSLENQ